MVSPASRRGERNDRGGGERRGGRGGRGRDREQRQRDDDSGGFNERVVHTRRIAKVVKGGRRLRFNALVVVGDGQGRVGAGMGKALAIPDAVRKGTAVARRSTINIPIKGSTIPHEISVRKGASIVIIKPAPLGTGIIAAGAMRAMLELGGVQDVVGKSLGSRNPINIVQATLEALSLLRDPETERANRLGLNQPATNGAAESSEASGEGSRPAAAEAPVSTAGAETTAETEATAEASATDPSGTGPSGTDSSEAAPASEPDAPATEPSAETGADETAQSGE
ncbi:MAG: 30S ribosomal protein S5 [Chloroflexota bacterium]|nr:30S ribosomal protein S5 [Chloroflexota bacterium]MDE2683784.1 30S ribosomal protein S5 [Chloroflexota bacterium]